MTTQVFEDLFIFEMANNHQGSVKHGVAIIEEMGRIARARGIRAGIKFQFRDLDTFIHPAMVGRDDVPHVPRFLSTRLSVEQFQELIDSARAEGLLVVSTPFDEASVRQCVAQQVDIIKVASCSATDWPLLEAVAAAGKPVIVSTGGVRLGDIDNIVSYLTHRDVDFAVLHCVARYPAPRESLNLAFIERMRGRYPGVPIGYSGHEDPSDVDAVKVAVSKGATVLERHIGLATDGATLNAYSLSPEQTDAWVAAAVHARILGGSQDKEVSEEEVASLRSLARGVYASKALPAGHTLTRDDVFFAMPCEPGQTTAGEFGRFRTTFVTSRAYNEGQAIEEASEMDPISYVREIVHDVKGMLYEAHVVLGDEVEIELSHHYGLERFREVGAVIVSVVNREYCKKLVVVLPGQFHPNHHHSVKEETFQLLWGDLELTLDGSTRRMKPGDTALVERGAPHSFSSKGGAIVEEISTTHVRNDSYYEEPAIARLDPLERKTILDSW